MSSSDTPGGSRFLNISTMKDEGPFILEWVAWNRVIGFTDLLVFTNDCTDGTDLILKRLEQLGMVQHEHNDVLRRGPHKSALKYAFGHPLYAQADWVFVSDVDEFLNIHFAGGRVEDLLAAYPAADVIPVAWRPFSANGITEVIDGLITERLTDAAPVPGDDGKTPAAFIKTLFRRTDDVERLGLHRPFFREGAKVVWLPGLPGDDDRLRLVGELGLEIAQLNHYAVRSAKSFLVKRDRGRANHTAQTLGLDYWERWNAGGTEDRSIFRHRKALRAEYDHLMSDPILAALHGAAVKIHRKRAEDLLEASEAREIYEQIVKEMAEPSHDTQGTAPRPEAPLAERADKRNDSGTVSPAAAKAIIETILRNSDNARRAPKRRELRQKMLDEVMPKGGRCAEIGVWDGDFSAEILNITAPKELVLIDPWDLLAERVDEHTHAKHSEAATMRAKYDHVAGTLGRLPNCVLKRGFSSEVLATYPDGYFDWIYIDGNHMYDAVLEDILIAARKVRPGGVIAGDDLHWKRDDRMHVREAVAEAMQHLGDRATRSSRGAQYIIQLSEGR